MSQPVKNRSQFSSLEDFACDVYSQYGEDGILERIFSLIKETNPWAVEFGAWDGFRFSNTANLIRRFDWSCVFIECDESRYQELNKNYFGDKKVTSIQRLVDVSGPNRLDELLASTKTPLDFSLLSIDIDGCDYHVWESVVHYRPKVVVIEYNPSIPADVEFVQPCDSNVSQGNSLLALVNLGKRKGYELIVTTRTNAFFVVKELFPIFQITDNSPANLKRGRECETRVFQLYDGTLVTSGNNRYLWHKAPFNFTQPKSLPNIFRQDPEQMGSFRRFLWTIYRRYLAYRFEGKRKFRLRALKKLFLLFNS